MLLQKFFFFFLQNFLFFLLILLGYFSRHDEFKNHVATALNVVCLVMKRSYTLLYE